MRQGPLFLDSYGHEPASTGLQASQRSTYDKELIYRRLGKGKPQPAMLAWRLELRLTIQLVSSTP